MLLSAETPSKSLPFGYRPEDEAILEALRNEALPSVGLRRLSHASLIEDGSVLSGASLVAGCLRPEMAAGVTPWRRLRYVFYRRMGRLSGPPVVHIADHNSHEYYHWFFEALPRLILARKGHPGPFGLVLGERHRTPYILESLRLLGLKDTVFLPRHGRLDADTVLLPDYAAGQGLHRAGLLAEVRSVFCDGAAPEKPGKRIYLSRAKARYRKILNEAALVELLSRHGFECVVAEELGFQEQLRLFSGCSVLLSNHGAGLANLLFLPRGACLVECRKDRLGLLDDSGRRESPDWFNCYYRACDALGLRYAYLACPSPEPDRSCHKEDIQVDLVRLEGLLRSLGLV